MVKRLDFSFAIIDQNKRPKAVAKKIKDRHDGIFTQHSFFVRTNLISAQLPYVFSTILEHVKAIIESGFMRCWLK